MSLALRTNTLPAQWLAEDDVTIVTAFDILREQDEANERGSDG